MRLLGGMGSAVLPSRVDAHIWGAASVFWLLVGLHWLCVARLQRCRGALAGMRIETRSG